MTWNGAKGLGSQTLSAAAVLLCRLLNVAAASRSACKREALRCMGSAFNARGALRPPAFLGASQPARLHALYRRYLFRAGIEWNNVQSFLFNNELVEMRRVVLSRHLCTSRALQALKVALGFSKSRCLAIRNQNIYYCANRCGIYKISC